MNEDDILRLLSLLQEEDSIYEAEQKRKLPYIQVSIDKDITDPMLRWWLENMDCFGEFEADNRVCGGGCLLAKGCEQYTKNHGL